jgi:hypothetical protein
LRASRVLMDIYTSIVAVLIFSLILVDVVLIFIIRSIVGLYFIARYRTDVQERVVPDDLGDFSTKDLVISNGSKNLNVAWVRRFLMVLLGT